MRNIKIKKVLTSCTQRILLICFTITFSAVSVFSQEKAYTYSNPYLGLSFDVPSGWYVAGKQEKNWGLQKNVFLDLENLSRNAKDNIQLDAMIFSASLDTPSPGRYFSDFSIVAIDARSIANKLTSVEDFLESAAKNNQEIHSRISGIEVMDTSFANNNFNLLHFELYGKHTYQLAKIHNDYLVLISMNGGQKSLNEIFYITDRNLKLYSVSDKIDQSRKGKRFRVKSSLKEPSKKSFMQELTIIGKLAVLGMAALVIRGLYWLLRKIYGKKYPKFFTYFDD